MSSSHHVNNNKQQQIIIILVVQVSYNNSNTVHHTAASFTTSHIRQSIISDQCTYCTNMGNASTTIAAASSGYWRIPSSKPVINKGYRCRYVEGVNGNSCHSELAMVPVRYNCTISNRAGVHNYQSNAPVHPNHLLSCLCLYYTRAV